MVWGRCLTVGYLDPWGHDMRAKPDLMKSLGFGATGSELGVVLGHCRPQQADPQ